MAALLRMFKNRWFTPPKPVNESYEGRNIIVTGSTSGIGLEAVVKFASLGAAKVVIAARDLKKGDATKAAIEKRVGRTDQLEVWELNMDSFESVIAFAERAEGLDHLDIAILNAGVHRSKYGKSKDGWEEDLQVNTLSTTLLGIMLLPKLRESKHVNGKIPVLQFVNSGLHQNAIVSPETRKESNIIEWYNKPENFGEFTQYKFTKVFLMYAAGKLAEVVSSAEVIITSICPGPVLTDIGRDHYIPGIQIFTFLMGLLFFLSPEKGANPILSGTTQGEQAHGRFWKFDKIMPIAPSLSGEENKKLGVRVWGEIMDILQKEAPVVNDALDAVLGNQRG